MRVGTVTLHPLLEPVGRSGSLDPGTVWRQLPCFGMEVEKVAQCWNLDAKLFALDDNAGRSGLENPDLLTRERQESGEEARGIFLAHVSQPGNWHPVSAAHQMVVVDCAKIDPLSSRTEAFSRRRDASMLVSLREGTAGDRTFVFFLQWMCGMTTSVA